jgi:hypothetical protein
MRCPKCNGENFQEIAYRYTWQPVGSLKPDGEADDYGEFDYGDDVFVVGWECVDCNWSAEGDTAPINDAFAAAREQALEQLKAAAA